MFCESASVVNQIAEKPDINVPPEKTVGRRLGPRHRQHHYSATQHHLRNFNRRLASPRDSDVGNHRPSTHTFLPCWDFWRPYGGPCLHPQGARYTLHFHQFGRRPTSNTQNLHIKITDFRLDGDSKTTWKLACKS